MSMRIRRGILAIDTATEACSAALLTPTGIATRYSQLQRVHAEHILEMVDAVLAEAGVALAEVDAVAFGRGPGAFTGCRLAASVAQGLAFGAARGVVPVSDLRALAQRVLDQPLGARGVLVCSDARMQEVYWGCFRRDARGLAEPCGIEHVGAPETVELPPELEGPVHGAGGGFLEYPKLRGRLEGRLVQVHGEWLPRAEEVARLAVPEVVAGRLVAPHEARPVYLRNDVTRPRGSPGS
jgi:tRNA threonylcarbamoyladenosine biosynthesis protein TsaB